MEVGEISQYFPHFVWLLRDVSLITCEEEGGKEMDPTDYIKQKVRFSQESKTNYVKLGCVKIQFSIAS